MEEDVGAWVAQEEVIPDSMALRLEVDNDDAEDLDSVRLYTILPLGDESYVIPVHHRSDSKVSFNVRGSQEGFYSSSWI